MIRCSNYFVKKILLRVLSVCLLIAGAGCVTPGTKTTVTSGQGSPTIGQAQAESYNGPKARIAVSRFKDKTGASFNWWNRKIGDGMADQLTTALFNSNRFIVLERQALSDVLMEQDLGAGGRIRSGTAAPIGQIEGAELLVVAAVTEFEGAASGAGGGLGGFGGGILGAVVGGFKRSHMAIDLRIIDSRTSRILAATSVEGSSTDVNLGGALGGFFGGGALGGALGGWKNTPTEKALRAVIQEAVKFIITKTPQTYYHIGGNSSGSRATGSSAARQTGPGRSVVKEMQGMLNDLGYNTGTPDGLAGQKTRTAVKEFQQDKGMKVTGKLDTATIKKIRAVAQ